MRKRTFSVTSDWFKISVILIASVIIGGILFLINGLSNLLNALLYIIQSLFGIIFAIWYFRIFLIFIKEIRKKEPEKKIGLPLSWSIYGLIICLFNIIVWGFFSPLSFNVPKIIFFIPTVLMLVEISYIFIKANRRRLRDWLILTYNIIIILYLLNWTLIDFGIDLPNFLGVFEHTLNSSNMLWQFIFLNSSAFIMPTFIFPPYMLNPRYYFAMPYDKYLELKEAENKTKTDIEEQIPKEEELRKEKAIVGERKPFFEERKLQKRQEEESLALNKQIAKKFEEDDVKYAEHISTNDISYSFRKIVLRLDNFLRMISLSIILMLIVITPITFSGIVTMNVIPDSHKLNYNEKPEMVIGIFGNIFSNFDAFGNISSNWQERVDKEIAWSKEMHITHLRYDIKSEVLANNQSVSILNQGFQRIKDNGLKIIFCLDVGIVFSKKELINQIYLDAKFVAENYQPDYLIIYNELNGKMLSYVTELINLNDWLPELINVTTVIKSASPTTKVVTTLLAMKNELDYFKSILTNNTIAVDVIGINYYPIFFGWNKEILLDYARAFTNTTTTKKFWISEIGIESFNYGEAAQAKFLSKIASMATIENELNADGIIIKSLIDNHGISIEKGIVSHLGIVYFNDRKKKAYFALSYAFGQILAII